MNYIYDILLNFHKEDFDYYEWNMNDNIIHIRKIPLIRVNSDLLYKMINFEFSLSNDCIKKISNRTESFSNKNIKIIKNMGIFSDGSEAIAIKFTDNGTKEKVSRLLLDEKEEILMLADNLEETKIDIILDKEITKNKFRTREEQQIYNYIRKSFHKKNYDKLKYTYFECFNSDENDYDKIITSLKQAIDNNWNLYYEKIYDILRLSSMKKSKN